MREGLFGISTRFIMKALDTALTRNNGTIHPINVREALIGMVKEADFIWDEEKLDRFMANPDEVVPGNNMKPYGGLASGDERKKIIAFLAREQ